MSSYLCVAPDVKLGLDVKLSQFINLYGCEIGDKTKIGAFVEIQKNARVGKNCKISSHTFICEGVTIEDDVFIGHGVKFINDTYPRATNPSGSLQTEKDWKVETTFVRAGASIGSGATILSNIVIGERAIIGAGSVVTRDVPPDCVVAGNPARTLRVLTTAEQILEKPMNTVNSVPFLDLVSTHHDLKDELCGAFRSALETASFIGGPPVEEFERQFAAYCKTQYCVGVGSGTDALRFALMAAGVRPGDTVITVPNSFIATGEAISQAGATPAFVDVDERTYNLDPGKLKEYLETACHWNTSLQKLVVRSSGSPLTAIVPVHLYGQPADMDPIADLAEQYGLILLEDACQAHGADYFSKRDDCWKRAGSMGRAAAFSFYPGKNLGACGEAGAVTTNDEELASKIRMLRDHGQIRKYYHDLEGFNGRLDAIQASVLTIKLKYLDGWTARRREAALRYRELLRDEVMLPYQPSWAQAVYHLFVVCVPDREQIMKQLSLAGIGTGIHYPIPLHLQRAYNYLGYSKGDFPVSERLSDEVLSLPMGPGLTAEQQERVAAELLKSVMPKPWACAATH